MLPCIVCSKQVEEDTISEGGTPKSMAEKDGLKSITHQLKDMVVKASIAYRQCKPGSAAIFNDDPPIFDEFLTPAGTSSGTATIASGKHGLTRSISKTSSSSRSIKSPLPSPGPDRRSQAAKGVQGRSPKSPAISIAHPYIAQPQADRKKPSIQDDVGQEWVAQVEPGVLITFLALPNGGNDLKRIRFSRNLFSDRQAEAWWIANSEKVHELYNVSGKEKLPATLPIIHSLKEAESSTESRADASPTNSPRLVGDFISKANMEAIPSSHIQSVGSAAVKNKADATTSDTARGNGSEYLTEDEPGVYITIKVLAGGTKALKRVRFSCDKFDERQAKLWWEKNRFRIHEQYVREPTHDTPLNTI